MREAYESVGRRVDGLNTATVEGYRREVRRPVLVHVIASGNSGSRSGGCRREAGNNLTRRKTAIV